eukprot:3528617-Pyramimonas_sp.AAC.1
MGRRGTPKDANGLTTNHWNVTSAISHNSFAANARGAMAEAEARRRIWLKLTRTCSALTGSHFWPTLPTAQLPLLIPWLPDI